MKDIIRKILKESTNREQLISILKKKYVGKEYVDDGGMGGVKILGINEEQNGFIIQSIPDSVYYGSLIYTLKVELYTRYSLEWSFYPAKSKYDHSDLYKKLNSIKIGND